MRREKSLRIGEHNACGVVWGPVYRTHPPARALLARRASIAAASLLHLDEDTFDEVTVMSYVRFKCKQLANGEAHYRLVQVNRIEHGDEYEVNPGTPDTTKTTRWLVCNNMGTEKTLALADIRCVLYTGPHTTALAW